MAIKDFIDNYIDEIEKDQDSDIAYLAQHQLFDKIRRGILLFLYCTLINRYSVKHKFPLFFVSESLMSFKVSSTKTH